MHPKIRTLPALMAAALAAGGLAHSGAAFAAESAAGANELESLRAEVRALKERLDSLASNAAAAAPAAHNTAAQAPVAAAPQNAPTAGALHSNVGGMDITLGGYVQLNAIRDTGPNVAAAGDRDFFFVPDISLPGSATYGQKGKTFLSARTSRLFVSASKPSDYGPIKAHIEGDFFTSDGGESQANSAHFRLRHAYGAVGNWMFGQYWSTFIDTSSMPDVMDFGGPTGQVFVRQPQVRYTKQFDHGQSLALALENSNNDSVANAHTSLPDFVARYQLTGAWGHVSLAGVLRRISSDDGFGGKVNRTATGLSLAGSFNLWKGDSLAYQINGGRGIGRYMSDAGGETAVLAGSHILFQPAYGAYVSYQHQWWDSPLRSALVLGRTWFDNNALRQDANYAAAATNRRLSTIHANLIWTPVKGTDVGLEYIYGKREVDSGRSGVAHRVLLGVITSF